MEFKKFEKGDRFIKDVISIRPTGSIFFNAGFYRRVEIKAYRYAMLFHDAASVVIGFKFLNNVEEGCYKISHQKDCATVRASAFFDVFLSECNRTMNSIVGKYTPEYDKENEMYIVRFK